MTAVRKDLRHRARETALQILYAWEIGHTDIEQAAHTFFSHQWVGTGGPPDDVREFATELARDTVARLQTIDPLIAETAERWRPERMAVLDRLILRMAVCELMRDAETPRAAVINEARELGRTISSDVSVKFISGMLEAISKKVEM